MLKNIGLVISGLLVGIVIGCIVTMAYGGCVLSRGMFLLQDGDIIQLEEAATEAYLHQSPEVGIWAIENYLSFFDSVIERRTVAIADEQGESTDDVFILATPKLRWISYARLALLYEKTGKLTKRDDCFQKAVEILGPKKEGEQESREIMFKVVKEWDEKSRDKEAGGNHLLSPP
jgi:hypothetical protein